MDMTPKFKNPAPLKWVRKEQINEEYVEQLEKDYAHVVSVLQELVDSVNPQAFGKTRTDMVKEKYVGSKTIPTDESVLQALEVLIFM